jgi:hypothetical protein
MAERIRRPERDENFRETLAPTSPYVEPVPATRPRDHYYTFANLIYVGFGLLEIALALRFFFLLLGANSGNGFVSFIYGLTAPFMAPFYGIFGSTPTGIIGTFDPGTLVAFVVYGVIAWALVRLVAASSNRPADGA